MRVRGKPRKKLATPFGVVVRFMIYNVDCGDSWKENCMGNIKLAWKESWLHVIVRASLINSTNAEIIK